jgi:hypothetical protein
MSELNLAATSSTPSVLADSESGLLEMRGDSYPENSFEFFTPVLDWLRGHLDGSASPVRLELHLLYLNTSSVKVMMDIFDLLEDAHGQGREVAVRWYYDHDNARIAELAAEFKEDCTFPFEILPNEG